MAGVTTGPYYTAPGRRRTVGKLSVWAEDGLIFCEWQDESFLKTKDPGEVEVLDVPGAKRWLHGMHDDLAHWDGLREGAPSPDKRAYAIEYYHRLKAEMDAIRETIYEAEQQGDQSNPEIRLKKLRAFLRGRRGSGGQAHNALPSLDGLLYPTPYERPRIFTTGKNDNRAVYFDTPKLPQ